MAVNSLRTFSRGAPRALASVGAVGAPSGEQAAAPVRKSVSAAAGGVIRGSRGNRMECSCVWGRTEPRRLWEDLVERGAHLCGAEPMRHNGRMQWAEAMGGCAQGPGAKPSRAGALRRFVPSVTRPGLIADLGENAGRAARDALVVRVADHAAALAQRHRALPAGVDVLLAEPRVGRTRLDGEGGVAGAAGDRVVHVGDVERAVVEDAEDVGADV